MEKPEDEFDSYVTVILLSLLSIQIVIYCFAVFPISNPPPPPPFLENSLYSSLSHEGRRSSLSSFFHYSWVLSSCFWFILNKNMYENQAIMKRCVYSLDIHIPTFICTGWDSFRRLFFIYIENIKSCIIETGVNFWITRLEKICITLGS